MDRLLFRRRFFRNPCFTKVPPRRKLVQKKEPENSRILIVHIVCERSVREFDAGNGDGQTLVDLSNRTLPRIATRAIRRLSSPAGLPERLFVFTSAIVSAVNCKAANNVASIQLECPKTLQARIRLNSQALTATRA